VNHPGFCSLLSHTTPLFHCISIETGAKKKGDGARSAVHFPDSAFPASAMVIIKTLGCFGTRIS
jgi:hypothetical protein